MFLGLGAATPVLRSHHRLSIRFKSGDCDGHSRTFQPFCSNQAFVDFDVCLGSSNVQSRPSFNFLTDLAIFLARIFWYLLESIIPSTRCRLSVPLEAKHTDIITDPVDGRGSSPLTLCSPYARHTAIVHMTEELKFCFIRS